MITLSCIKFIHEAGTCTHFAQNVYMFLACLYLIDILAMYKIIQFLYMTTSSCINFVHEEAIRSHFKHEFRTCLHFPQDGCLTTIHFP